MERGEAIRLMAVYEAMSACLGPVLNKQTVSDAEEADRLGLEHCRLIMFIYENYMRPIIRPYPDLDPDRRPDEGQPSAAG